VTIVDDLRHAIRRLRAQPATAAIAAGMLALAIGITSAMFTVVDHLLLRPVPYRDPSRLVAVWIGTGPESLLPYVSRETILAWRASPAFSAVHGVVQQSVVVEGQNGLSSKGAVWITPGTFEMLGAAPLLGRTFVDGEGQPGTDDRAIISENVWRSQYEGDPQIIGRRVVLSGAPATVVGVMPSSFHFPFWNVEVWRPYDLGAGSRAGARGPLMAFARVTGNVPLADAARLATAAASGIERLQGGRRVILRGVAAGFLDDYTRTAIAALAGGIGLVFLVLCANATNLILARTAARRKEFGVCSALGASRSRLLRQAFAENVLLTLAATAAGLTLAWMLVSVARSVLPEDVLVRTLNRVQLDLRAVAATALLALIAAVGAGLPPAWIGTSLDPADSIRGIGRAGTDTRASRTWTRTLLVGEVALATALLAGAGVLVSSFVKLMSMDPGLNTRGVMTAWVSLPGFYFQDRAARAGFAEELRRQIAGLPGVDAVALSYGLPPRGGANTWDPVRTDVPGAPERNLDVLYSYVGPGFFRVYGIGIVQGREFEPGDGPDQAIVSEKLAQALWPGMSPLGHAFTFKGWNRWLHVVGVSHEVRSTSFDPRSDIPEFYTPLTLGSSQVMVGLRCAASCPGEAAIRDRIRAASPKTLVATLQPLETAYLDQFERPRAAAGLAFAFAIVSVLAAAGGLFSVLSYAVGRRRREFGIRIAMGARPHQIRLLVLREGLTVAAAGLALGAFVAWTSSRALVALAFGVTMLNPLVWLAAMTVVGGATLLAAWRPAVSAMRTDPLVLLREE
jgi:putative ABC transport system permease protein